MAHHHHPSGPGPGSPRRAHRLLLLGVLPFVVATAVGLVVLWPDRSGPRASDLVGPPADLYPATVTSREAGSCGAGDLAPRADATSACLDVTVRLQAGPDKGQLATLFYSEGPGSPTLAVGTSLVVGRSVDESGTVSYYFSDFERRLPMLALTGLFVVAVIALARWRGVAALASLALTLLVLVVFVLPSILDGNSPLAVALVGSAAVMFLALYLTHGPSAQTSTAVLGTMASLGLISALSVLFMALHNFSGLANEEAGFLQLAASNVSLRGLLLAGVIIGSLGVLDDVTVTQTSAVWRLHEANPTTSPRRLYRSALEIGRDHIASTVNTLVLAYAGASLPLLVLFGVAGNRFTDVVTSEVVAVEVVRTLVGSIGLVASVPLTTALAVLVVTRTTRQTPPGPSGPGGVRDPGGPQPGGGLAARRPLAP